MQKMSSSLSSEPVAASGVSEVEQWHNNFQLLAAQANPRILVVEAGRRGGKSEIILAKRTLRPMYLMPGSSGFLSGKSYSKLLDHMMPALMAGWGMLNFIEHNDTQDGDYVIGRTPPKGWKLPIMAPKKWDHYLCTRWGSGAHLMSQDHSVTANALTTDWGAIDEAKQHDPVRVQSELLKTMSGHRSIPSRYKDIVWGDLPEHLMLTLLTDKFIGKYDYRWADQYRKESMSMAAFCKLAKFAERVHEKKNGALQRELWAQQRDAVMYLEYSSRESLPIIGIDYYKNQFKGSKPIEFRTSILNEDVKEIDGGFYKFLDEKVHTYEARDNNRIDSIGISDYLKGKNKNCLLDRDWRKDLPLKVGVDYGTAHTWFLIAQRDISTHWFINNFWTNREQLNDGVDRICAYYRPQEKKYIELYDDPSGHKANPDQQKDVEKVKSRFRYHGWTVVHKTPSNAYIPHRVKYRIWELGLDERSGKRDERFTKARWNLNNAYECFYSCSKAPVKIGMKDEYQKDKSSEKDDTIEQWKATHLSDCADMIYCNDNIHLVDSSISWMTW